MNPHVQGYISSGTSCCAGVFQLETLPLNVVSALGSMTDGAQRVPFEFVVQGPAGSDVNVTMFHQAPPDQPNLIIKLMGSQQTEKETNAAQARYNEMLTFLRQHTGHRPTRPAGSGDLWNVVLPENDEAHDL